MDQSPILSRLSIAETALRGNLQRHDLNAKTRTHVERALVHAQEAMVAIRSQSAARSVDDLVKDLEAAKQVIVKDQYKRLFFSRRRYS